MMPHPTYSPDMPPCNFFLFPKNYERTTFCDHRVDKGTIAERAEAVDNPVCKEGKFKSNYFVPSLTNIYINTEITGQIRAVKITR